MALGLAVTVMAAMAPGAAAGFSTRPPRKRGAGPRPGVKPKRKTSQAQRKASTGGAKGGKANGDALAGLASLFGALNGDRRQKRRGAGVPGIGADAARGAAALDRGDARLGDAVAGDEDHVDNSCRYRCPHNQLPSPRPGHVPVSNGCGLAGMNLNMGFPEFTKCCDGHDICYHTCGNKFYDCEDQFEDCLTEVCKGFKKNKEKLKKCKNAIAMMQMGTNLMGCGPYMSSQEEACVCLPKAIAARKLKDSDASAGDSDDADAGAEGSPEYTFDMPEGASDEEVKAAAEGATAGDGDGGSDGDVDVEIDVRKAKYDDSKPAAAKNSGRPSPKVKRMRRTRPGKARGNKRRGRSTASASSDDSTTIKYDGVKDPPGLGKRRKRKATAAEQQRWRQRLRDEVPVDLRGDGDL